MTKLKLKKPKKADLPNNLMSRPLQDIIYQIIQSCELDIEDKVLLENIAAPIASTESGTDESSNSGKLKDEKLEKELNTIKKQIKALQEQQSKKIEVSINKKAPVELGLQHFQFETLLRVVSAQMNAYMVGPAGSGKTTAAVYVAKALGVNFYFTGAIASEFKLTGFIDANGKIVNTEFRRAYEHGGLFLFDEIDASYPQAVLAFNAALANDYMDFPDKRVTRHKDFYCIAAANTFGQGADRQYVGRNQLDAASLDRFVFLDWQFDEDLERALAGNDKWVDFVQAVRRVVDELKIRHVVSPRASIFGVKLLAADLSLRVVVKTLLWKGLDKSTIDKIKLNLNYDLERFYEKGIKV